jgi:hypothetical protein
MGVTIRCKKVLQRALSSVVLNSAVFGCPALKACSADLVLAAQVGRFHAGLVLFGNGNELLFRMSLGLPRLVPLRARLQFTLDQFKEQYQWSSTTQPMQLVSKLVTAGTRTSVRHSS